MIDENIQPERVEEDSEDVVEERPELPELAQLVRLRDQLQKLRIAEGNRVGALVRGGRERGIHGQYFDRLLDFEEDIGKAVVREMREHPAWPWLSSVHGVGEMSAASVVAHIDITRCNTVSALWRYAGWSVVLEPCDKCDGGGTIVMELDGGEVDCPQCHGAGSVGKRERPTKGEKLHYNKRLKTMVWRLIDLQVKLRGPYRQIYDNAKFTYTTTRKDWTKMHVELAARRKAAKMFLSHLWDVWRKAEGLPTVTPFIGRFPEHDIIGGEEFVDVFEKNRKEAKEVKAALA